MPREQQAAATWEGNKSQQAMRRWVCVHARKFVSGAVFCVARCTHHNWTSTGLAKKRPDNKDQLRAQSQNYRWIVYARARSCRIHSLWPFARLSDFSVLFCFCSSFVFYFSSVHFGFGGFCVTNQFLSYSQFWSLFCSHIPAHRAVAYIYYCCNRLRAGAENGLRVLAIPRFSCCLVLGARVATFDDIMRNFAVAWEFGVENNAVATPKTK